MNLSQFSTKKGCYIKMRLSKENLSSMHKILNKEKENPCQGANSKGEDNTNN